MEKTELLTKLYIAEEMARKHKTNKPYVKVFERDLYKNLSSLCDDLYNRSYVHGPSVCFIINHPKKREVFAASYRDRVVHHLYFNMVHEMFERCFIYDSYSCIKGRGTHFGIDRLSEHIIKESENYTKDCYVLKMDIRGYFMHIDRNLLLEKATSLLERQRYKKIKRGSSFCWDDKLDFDFLYYLTKKLILLDPTISCTYRSNPIEWYDLPKSKSLFYSEDGYGLPIGNLTSQLFSNVFLNELDQYMKRVLKCKRYGRYVDDFYVVSKDRLFIKELIPLVENFLKENLHLSVSKGKTKIVSYRQGVEFLGIYIKPYRRYVSNSTLKRIKMRLNRMERCEYDKDIEMSLNSILGVFKHCSSFKLRKRLFDELKNIKHIGCFNDNWSKFVKLTK